MWVLGKEHVWVDLLVEHLAMGKASLWEHELDEKLVVLMVVM